MAESLLAAIERHETQADSYGNVSDERTEALDRYLGRPMGNEIDGRSQVVSRDVWDTVEWLKPQLAEVFCGGDQVVSFAPKGPEDVGRAEQETEYVNHVITEKNDWFTVFNGWQHDALLQKNGYVLAYWDEREDRSEEQYKGLTGEELAILTQDADVEIVSGQANEDGTYDVTMRRVAVYGCAKIANVAPEKVRVSKHAKGLSLQDPTLDFCEYEEDKTISQLREEGFEVDDDLSDHSGGGDTWEETRRDQNNPLANTDDGETDPASRVVKVRTVWIRWDEDGDGRAELRRVVVVGKTILSNEEADEVTLYAMCPTPLPHQHTGLSVADAVIDLEKIKTALLRGSLDNVYLANNGRYFVDENRVNLDDMLVSRPGGIVRVKGGLADAAMPFQHATNGQVSIPMLEYVDRIAQKRTGVSEAMQGLNSNSLNNSLGSGTNMAMVTAAQQRIKHIARTFAETGVKSLFRGVHMLTLKHARKPEIVRMRNQWVPVDPREWKKRNDLSIAVGLGSGDRPAQLMMLEKILMIQAQSAGFGLADPGKVYNTLKRLTTTAGYKDPNEFWTDPATVPPKPPSPPPEVLKEQAKAMAAGQLKQMELQFQQQAQMRDHAIKMRELEAQLQLQQSNDMRDAEREQLKAQMQAQLEAEKLALERWKQDLQAQVDLITNERDNTTKLTIAGQQAETQQAGQMMQIGHEAMQKDAERKQVKEMKAEEVKPQKDAADQTKHALSQVTSALEKLAKMQAQIVDGQKSLEQTMSAKRVLVRDPVTGKPTHSEIQK